ncbi:50S ribosomal protein L25/general stress protein Ctc [Puteibacter caeruleilacunae]|nr:50S ribosomal protein L25/general stress protein Ctc [Puteibacter caeruleilacunae]
MKSIEIKGQLRTAVGKKDAKNLRNAGNVPCVMYGGEAPVHFYADANEFRKVVYTPSVYLIDLNINGEACKAIMQDIQFHPVTDEILHIDFLQIFEENPVTIEIPVEVEGFAKGIKAGGKLKINLRRLKVKALAKDLPDTITLNVEELGLGESIKVEAMEVENLEFLNAKSTPVVSVIITRAARAAMNAAAAEN